MKKGIIAIVFMMLLGLVLITSFIISEVQYFNNVRKMKECEAIVTSVTTDINKNNVDNLKTVYVKYTIDSVEYNQELSTNTGISFGKLLTNLQVGDKTVIYYNPENPTHIASKITQNTGLIIAIIGLVSFVFGLVLLIVVWIGYTKRHRRGEI